MIVQDQNRSGYGENGATETGAEACVDNFDLGIPGIVADCIEALYRSTGVSARRRDRLFQTSVIICVLIGLVAGFHGDGMLYGPIGAALGVIFGVVAGALIGLAVGFVGGPRLRPEAKALAQVRLGNYRNAAKYFRRSEMWIFDGRGFFERAARIPLELTGISRSDLPPEIARANLSACEGILAESVGDIEEALNSYLKALDYWPRHTFILASAIDLVARERMFDRVGEVVEAAGEFVDAARDGRIVESVKGKMSRLLETAGGEIGDGGRVCYNEGDYNIEKKPSVVKSFSLVENPGSEISNGTLFIDDGAGEKSLKLAAMPFHLLMALAESMSSKPEATMDESQIGWVPINALLDKLPWTTAHVTNSNVHKLVYKVRTQMSRVGMNRSMLEENLNGCYRLNVDSDKISIKRAVRV